jgi:hypothetical protein
LGLLTFCIPEDQHAECIAYVVMWKNCIVGEMTISGTKRKTNLGVGFVDLLGSTAKLSMEVIITSNLIEVNK